MSSSLCYATPEEFVKAVDPSLEFLKRFKGSCSMGDLVCQVRRENIFYVLKARARFNPQFSFLSFERYALGKLSDVAGISHLVSDYGVIDRTFLTILKEYATGKVLSPVGGIDVGDIPLSYRENLWSQLTDTVRALTSKGYFALDIVGRNLVVSPNYQQITLVDAFYNTKDQIADIPLQMIDILFRENPKST